VKLRPIIVQSFCWQSSSCRPRSPSPGRRPVVVDEVIAQVNDGVVTLSQLKREMKERVDTLKQNGMSNSRPTARWQSVRLNSSPL